METLSPKEKDIYSYLFKSYYVVWKQRIENKKKEANAMFKSYYVVWKLLWWISPEEKEKLFKSYYVVWKQYSSHT